MARRKVTKPVDLRLVKEFSGLFLPLKLGTMTVKFLVDTGACWTLMSLAMVEECGLKESITEIREGGLATTGVLEAEVEAEGGYLLSFKVAVMRLLETPLLGMNFLLHYGCQLVLDPELPVLTVRPRRQVRMGLLCGVYKKCLVSDHLVTGILDTGSTHCFISSSLASEFNMKKRVCWPILVRLFDGRVTILFRKVRQVEVDIDGLRFMTDLFIYPDRNVLLLLGMNLLSYSTLDLEKKELLLNNANPLCIGGEQDPRPSLVSFTPPQFSILSSSGHFASSGTWRQQGYPLFKKWFKFLRRFRWQGMGRCGKNEVIWGRQNDPRSTKGSESGVEMGTGKRSGGY